MHASTASARWIPLALIVAACATGSAAAQDVAYVCVPGYPGESTDINHANWIVSYALDHGSASSGGPSNISDVSILKGTDRSSVALHQALAMAANLGKVVIEVCREPTAAPKECYYRLALEQTRVSSMSVAGSSCVDPGTSCTPSQTESLSFDFTRISWSYTEFSGGKAGASDCRCWDKSGNMPCSCPALSCTP